MSGKVYKKMVMQPNFKSVYPCSKTINYAAILLVLPHFDAKSFALVWQLVLALPQLVKIAVYKSVISDAPGDIRESNM